ncbi:MAG: ankyrin repeat domain-containing protein [Alphaproteobacteria bacterium]|nr:ankyrin repeat domain-containing protein [Alphaproteobacteria bacterium]
MYSDFAKREKTPQDILLEQALKDAKDIPQAHEEWWDTAKPEEISAYYESIVSGDFWKNATISQLAVLIRNCADRNSQDKSGKTVLMCACEHSSSPELVRWFLQFKPDVNIRDKSGKSAQDYALANPALAKCADILAAIKFENLLCAEFWKTATSEDVASEIRAGKDVNMPGISGETPLMLACRYCHDSQVIQALLQAGADVNALNDLRFNSALMRACRWNNLEVVRLLVQAGADVNYAADRGYTALMSAAEFNPDAEIIRYLVANGADVCARDMYKRNARSYLKLNKILAQNKEIIAFLRKLELKSWWQGIIKKIFGQQHKGD